MADIELVMIDDFLIDCSINESHTFESDVTEYPVESGSNITDNIRPKPVVIEMECLVSNTPIGIMKTFRDNISTGENSVKPSEAAYEKLQAIRRRRKVVTIRTSLRTYENMALKSLNIPRSGKSGDDLRFTATFIQIETVENKRSIRVSTPIGNGKGKITKPLTPYDIRIILIDLYNKEWFDPDFDTWRKYFKYGYDTISVEVGGTVVPRISSTQKYHLWRGDRTRTEKGFTIKRSFVEAPSLSAGVAQTGTLRQIIPVQLSQCVCHNFGIISGTTNEANNNKVEGNKVFVLHNK